MLLKKKLILPQVLSVALGLVSVSVLAKGPIRYPAAPAKPLFTQNIYIQADMGYANVDWVGFSPSDNFTKNGKGGFTAGGSFGYSFMPNLAVELGGFYLPQATYSSGNGDKKIFSLVAYAAGRLSVPVAESLSLYGQAGVDFRDIHIDSNNKGHYWGPVFGVGGQYDFSPELYAQVQYMRVAGKSGSSNQYDNAVAADLFTLNIGYKFNF